MMRKLLIPVIILSISLFVRLVNINFPKIPVFDEILYENYSLHYLHHKPYFDVHPPLAVMLMSYTIENDRPNFRDIEPNKQKFEFRDYPYIKVRLLVGIFGATVPLSLYFIILNIYKRKSLAFLGAILSIFDNSLIVYSRLIVPDMIMISLGLGGIAVIQAVENKSLKIKYAIALVLGGILLGASASVKWLGLGFLAYVLLRLTYLKEYRKILLTIIIVVMTHVLIWIAFFVNFRGQSASVFSSYKKFIGEIHYPVNSNIIQIFKYLPQQFENMYRVTKMLKDHQVASRPIEWPLGGGIIKMYDDGKNEINFQGNFILWWLIVIAVLSSVVTISIPEKIYKKLIPVNVNDVSLLLFGYLICYLPLFFVGRMTFIYHYLSSLCFGITLVPLLEIIFKNKKLCRFIVVAVLAGFVIVSPVTYGFSVPAWWVDFLKVVR